MPTPTLKLPTCEHLDVFDVLVSVLKADGTLGRTVKVWRTWAGDPSDVADWTADQCPGVRLTPSIEDTGWFSPESLKGRLVVDVEIATTGTNLRNPALLWRAIKRALYPESRTETQAIQARLRDAGAMPHLVFFAPGLQYTPAADGAVIVATGRLSVQVIETLDP